MEETLQQEKQESEYKNQNEDQGGIRRRLRDRDLLRKRKAEAEEKETNQEESQRKRPRAEGGSKRRGRPKKSEPVVEIPVIQGQEAEAPAVVVVSEPAEVIPAQTSGSLSILSALESQPSSVPAPPAPLPVFGSIQSSIFAPSLTSPAPVYPTPALFSPSAPATSLAKVLDLAPIPVQDSAPDPDSAASVAVPAQDSAPGPDDVSVPVPVQDSTLGPVPVPVLTQAPVPDADPAPPPAAPPQVETLFRESQGREALDQVLIEDLGPDDEEDVSPSKDKRADEDLTETPSISVPEMFSIPTMSSTPPPQKYFSGNSY